MLPLLLLAAAVAATPYPRDDLHDLAGFGFLMPRACANYCGYDNQYCCASDQTCYTSSGIAGCANTADGSGYGVYTTTWTETETFTSTYSSYYGGSTATADCVPASGSGEIACGSICCASWQYCAYQGQCMSALGASATYTTYTTVYTSGGATVTSAYSAPYRVTSGTGTATGVLVSGSASANGTAASTSGGLSGGAIAGIVIGSIAGVCLLAALCACVLIRGLWNSVLALLGIGSAGAAAGAAGRRRRGESREEVTVIEEERYRRSGGGSAAHAGWFGRRRPASHIDESVVEKPRKKSSGLLGCGAAFATLLLLLGLRRHDKNKDRRPAPSRSDVSSNYYSGSYTMSGSSSRESRRTRGTRNSYRTEFTRPSQASRPSRQSRNPSRRR